MERRQFLKTTGIAGGFAGLYGTSSIDSVSAHHVSGPQDPYADQWDPAHSNNYDTRSTTTRSASDIDWIVIHGTLGAYDGTLSWFKNPDQRLPNGTTVSVSAHYVISNYEDTAYAPGHTTQMVAHEHAAWHASGGNMNSIGIEHEYIDGWGYSDELYQASADLVAWLADEYDVPLDFYDHLGAMCNHSGGIITHRKVPTDYSSGAGTCTHQRGKNCPFDWDVNEYQSILGSGGGGGGDPVDDPQFALGETVGVSGVDSLNARDQPTLDSNVVDELPEGTTAEVLDGSVIEDDIPWYYVDVPSHGIEAWCSANYLERVELTDPVDFTIDTDLNRQVDVTAAELDAAIAAAGGSDTALAQAELGETFVAVQQEYDVDAVYQAAHAIHESAWGESTIAQDKNNLYGWGAADDDPYGGAAEFASFADCVWEVMADIKELYLTPGDWRYEGPTLSGMNVYYATDDQWDVKIADHYRTLATHLGGVDEDDGQDDGGTTDPEFADGDQVVTTASTLNGREQPGLDTTVLVELPEGTTGEVVNGPEVVDGITWWGLHVPEYEAWVWCSGNYLEEYEEPDSPDSPSGGEFDMGESVVTTATSLNGRHRPGLDSTITEVLPEGTRAEVMNGPEVVDDVTWWGLYVPSHDVWVWCSGNYLDSYESPDTSGKFDMGDRVATTTDDLAGRRYPGLDSVLVRELEAGTVGEVVNGPEVVDDVTWWGLYVPSHDVWVWCSGNYLEEYTGDTEQFAMDDLVYTSSAVTGREQPGTDSAAVMDVPRGTRGEIVNGPEVVDGYTWWGLHLTEYAEWVWVPGYYLEHRSGDDAFAMGQVVWTTGDLNGRSGPGLDYSVEQVLPEGTEAEVINGPEENDGLTWWGLHAPAYNAWVWCSENYLTYHSGGPAFSMDQRVYTTGDLNGRSGPGLDYSVEQVLPEGTVGEVMNGPEESDDVTWWGLYVPDYGVWVWCSENYLQAL